MSRVARLGWLCIGALFGVGGAIWVLATLSGVLGEGWPNDPVVSFTLVFLWLPACLVALGSIAALGALFWYFGQQDATDRRRRGRRASSTAPREPSDPSLAFPVLDDEDGRAEPGITPDPPA